VLAQVSVDMARSFLASLKTRVGNEEDLNEVWLKLQEEKEAFTCQLASCN